MTDIKKIWIKEILLNKIKKDVTDHYPNETGGVLMGYTAINGDVVVTDIIMSGESALHKPCRFEPDQEYQERVIQDIFLSSNGNVTYLGDWHSHPDNPPQMSWLDKKTLFRIADHPQAQCPNPVMMILGYHKSAWDLNVVRLKKLTPCIFRPYSFKYEKLNLVCD